MSSSNKFSRVHSHNPSSNQSSQPVPLPPRSESCGIGLSRRGRRTGFSSPVPAHSLMHPGTGSRTHLEWDNSDDNSLLASTLHRPPSQQDTFRILPTADVKALKSSEHEANVPSSRFSMSPTVTAPHPVKPLVPALLQDSPSLGLPACAVYVRFTTCVQTLSSLLAP